MNNKIEIVVARYNENLEWINEEPFNKFPVVCYNKGNNNNFEIKGPHKVFNLENVGREGHTFLYHIINNYDNLADVTVFLPGSTNITHKMYKAKRIFEELEKNTTTIFLGEKFGNLKIFIADFKLDEWQSTSTENVNVNNESNLIKSDIRPFGKWFEHHFGNIKVKFATYHGVNAIAKKHILQHPKEYYINFLNELSVGSNPEVGHFVERAYCAMFYPATDAVYIIK
jgi:hypothetical protein